MVLHQNVITVPVIWRGKKFEVKINPEASLKELGEELQTLTDVKADTIRLIISLPSTKSSKLLMPFSDEHCSLSLRDTGIVEGKPLRMMGVSKDEIDNVLKDAEANLRIAGFEEEEKRMKQRMSRGSHSSLKLPQGPYIFCNFRTLELPGVVLNPPPSEAMKRMHMLAADPGIVAIMNKYRWRVGIMTEMAPVGYVGVSPRCVLGLNKNQGEEISLRLRTDDLKGFRKYQSIKKTLLHELAHTVYSEHDANFYALDKQLNQEAFTLDWTKSRSHTLADSRFSGHDDMDVDFDLDSNLPHKLGGEASLMSAGARVASVAAAFHRLTDSSSIYHGSANGQQNSNDYTGDAPGIPSPVDTLNKEELFIWNQHNDYSHQDELEPDPDNSEARGTVNSEPYTEMLVGIPMVKSNPDDTRLEAVVSQSTARRSFDNANPRDEPDPDDSEVTEKGVAASTVSLTSMQIDNNENRILGSNDEPDPDDSEGQHDLGNVITPNQSQLIQVHMEPDPDDCLKNITGQTQPESDDKVDHLLQPLEVTADEPDPDDELRRIQDPAAVFFNRLNKAIELLRTELNPLEAVAVLQTLFKIIRNVSENPNEMKYKKLRKANPVFQRNVAYHEAAMEVLKVVGFSEEVVTDEMGKAESYLVLKRNDPGLLWLAKSSLETSIAK
ncbi:uncharacterized protein LOC110701943 isoform X2 [Chenopodium quinoa]|uniref:WLM domain-containing protein n=2 Tax=Chenopodium quinoa TaxID=63459 RepID=A0A803LRJ1_CHEQI|nr:uncharacterized protein LOC110701943 isoform X2 [Chenopodium quinoa]